MNYKNELEKYNQNICRLNVIEEYCSQLRQMLKMKKDIEIISKALVIEQFIGKIVKDFEE